MKVISDLKETLIKHQCLKVKDKKYTGIFQMWAEKLNNQMKAKPCGCCPAYYFSMALRKKVIAGCQLFNPFYLIYLSGCIDAQRKFKGVSAG